MKTVKQGKYARRSSVSVSRTWKGPLIAAIIIFVCLCVIISIAVGILLGKKADKLEGRPKYNFTYESYESNGKTVKSADAFAYSIGTDIKGYLNSGVSDFSLCLRSSDGEVKYSSKLADEFLVNRYSQDSLAECVEYIHENGGYICGYFYLRSFNCDDGAMRELYKAYELALITEASEYGVDEILLLGVDVDEGNVEEIERFINKVSLSAGNMVIGVCLAPEVMKLTESNIYFASRIRNVCDFIAIDFTSVTDEEVSQGQAQADGAEVKTELEALIDEMSYYIKTYSARVILSKENSNLYDIAKELGIKNIQIVGK